jgi:hypothetical protein
VRDRESLGLRPSLRFGIIHEEAQGHLHGFNVAGRVTGGLKANEIASDGLLEGQFCYKDVISNQLCRRTGPDVHS